MSLLNRVANREIFDFLKTLTIKSTYFADKIRSTQIRSAVNDRVPETANPYVIHLAGEYVLSDIIGDIRGISPKHDDLYRPSHDNAKNHAYNKTRGRIKNFWRITEEGMRKLSKDELEAVVNPSAEGLYEYKPLVIEGIIDPVTGLAETQEYYRSQCIYDREGFLFDEMRYVDYLNDDCFDEMMWVTSLDTQQEIPFTLENLYVDDANEAVAQGRRQTNHVHTKTLEAYRVPGRYFDLLCKRYPKQVDLIKAIVYRVPEHEISSLVTVDELEQILLDHKYATPEYIASLKERFPNQRDLLKKFGEDVEGARKNQNMTRSECRRTRIAKAGNFSLLNCDTDLLDSTEYRSLLEHTHKVLDMIKRRWAVDEYNFEENYAAVLWTVLWAALPTALIAKRYANIKTPYVSESHMWDYLNSKGLADYRGYLTTEQTWFLYKNIEYLFQHAGQQKAMNILIDNLLSDYGLTIKSKTTVLDTTDSLSKMTQPTDPSIQCKYCSRRDVTCFKYMQDHLCDEWLGHQTLCKAEPIILTEEFAGASEAKILRRLINDYGYTEAAAIIKYKRSFIWKDEDIEAIKDDLNRDQLVDITGHVDSLEEMISIEHDSGLEPVFNDDVVEEQRKALQHMHGTYAPTKLLEMTKKSYNVKYAELFNRFITETFLRMAPKRNADGTLTHKVTCTYKFSTAEGASDYIFSFGEMLAAGYLGFVREYVVDAFVDEIVKDESGRPLYELVLDSKGKPIQIDTDSKGNPIYLRQLNSWVQKRFTDFMTKIDYNFAIPDKSVTTTAIKYGKPIMQGELLSYWIDPNRDLLPGQEPADYSSYLAITTNKDANTKILKIRDTLYAVTQILKPEEFCVTPDKFVLKDKDYYTKEDDGTYKLADVEVGSEIIAGKLYEEDSIWCDFPQRLKVLGQFVHVLVGAEYQAIYYENDDEIPVIPKYFKWYYSHLTPELDVTEEEKKSMKFPVKLAKKPIYELETVVGYESVETHAAEEEDTDGGFVDTYPDDPAHRDDSILIDNERRQDYRIFDISQFLDVSSLIDRWVDITGTLDDQSQIANYIDNMFEILEEVYCFASTSSSVRVHLAARIFLECILKRGTHRFDLLGLDRTHNTTEGGLCAFFSDWLKTDKELAGSFNVIDKLSDSNMGWNELNTMITKKLLEGCTIPYASESVTKSQYEKLKQLVVSLSSYRINFIDNTEMGQVCNSTVTMTEDAMIDKVTLDDIIYFDPVGDSTIPPRVGGYEQTDSDGNIIVPTSDLRRIKDKVYYTLGYKDSEVYKHPDEHQALHPVARPLGYAGTDVPEGRILSVGSEAINLPYVREFPFFRQTEDKYVLKDKTYFKYVELTGLYVEVEKTYFKTVKTSEITEELPENVLKDVDKGGNEIVYKIAIAFEPIEVGERLPVGKCFEKINLYTILGIPEGTPMLISKVDNKWYYCTGTSVISDYRVTGDGERHESKDYYIYVGGGLYRPTVDSDFTAKGEFRDDVVYYELSVIPGSQADVKKDNFNEDMYKKGDRFDLKNDFSNETAKKYLDSTIYRLNVPTSGVEWRDPIQSLELEHWLYPNVNHEFTLVEFKEPSILIKESSYPETENKEV